MSDPMNPTPPPSSETPPAHPTPPPAQTIPPTDKPASPSAADQLKTLNDNLVKAGSSVASVIAQAAKDQLGLDPVALLTPPKPKDDSPASTAPAQGTGTHAPSGTTPPSSGGSTTPQGGSSTPPGV